jgi:hypothetical protein
MNRYPQLLIVVLPLLFFIVSYLFTLVLVRLFKSEKHLTKLFIVFLALSPVYLIIYNLVYFDKIINFTIEIFFIFFNYMILALCYMGIHSGIELTSPTMSLLLNLRKNPLSEKDSLELMHRVANSRLIHLRDSFLLKPVSTGFIVSKVGVIIFKVLKKLDTL